MSPNTKVCQNSEMSSEIKTREANESNGDLVEW